MKTRCPCCGTTLSLDALVAHEGARDALIAAFRMGGALGGALVRYLALHRPETRELSMDRVAKLLSELLPDVQAQRITRAGQVFDAPADAWIWAIEQAIAARDAGRLKTPLKGHGYLYEVLSNYRNPAPDVLAAPSAAQLGRTSSTLSGLAALEAMKHGC